MTKLHDRLALALLKDGRTQREIAAKAGFDEPQLARWKNGHAMPNPDNIHGIVDVLGISAHWLITGDGPMRPTDIPREADAYRRIAEIVLATERRAEPPVEYPGDVADGLPGPKNRASK